MLKIGHSADVVAGLAVHRRSVARQTSVGTVLTSQQQLVGVLTVGTSSVAYVHINNLEVRHTRGSRLALGAGSVARTVA